MPASQSDTPITTLITTQSTNQTTLPTSRPPIADVLSYAGCDLRAGKSGDGKGSTMHSLHYKSNVSRNSTFFDFLFLPFHFLSFCCNASS